MFGPLFDRLYTGWLRLTARIERLGAGRGVR